MKIVIGAHDYLPNTVGGVAVTTAQLVDAFVSLGHDVAVAALTPGPAQRAPYAIYRNPPPWVLTRLYREADILITTNLAIKLIYPLLTEPRPFALQHHSESAFHLSRAPASPDGLRRAVLPWARHFVTSAFIGRKSGFADYVVTPPFPDAHAMRADDVPPQARTGALFAGRLETEKGVRWLLQRWPKVQETLGVEELRLAGAGSLLDEIRQRIVAGELPGVRLLGALDRPHLAHEMKRAAFCITPSLWDEPFGAVALEAIAAGALTILTNRGGLPEAGGTLGFYFEPSAPGSFDAALSAARETFTRHVQDPAARADYEARVARHIERFQPVRVAETIIREMSAHPRAVHYGAYRDASA